ELGYEGIINIAIRSLGVYGPHMAKQVRRPERLRVIAQFVEVETDRRGVRERRAEVTRRGHDLYRTPLGCADDTQVTKRTVCAFERREHLLSGLRVMQPTEEGNHLPEAMLSVTIGT